MKISGKTILSLSVAAGILFAAGLAAPAVSFAQTAVDTPTPTPASVLTSTPSSTAQPAKPALSDTRIEQIYQQQQKALAAQETNLNNSTKLISRVQSRINALKAKGKDVAPLQQALEDFRLMLPDARAAHKTAADILSRRAGFNASGQVVTRSEALETIRDAGQALRSARSLYAQAAQDLRSVLTRYRNI